MIGLPSKQLRKHPLRHNLVRLRRLFNKHKLLWILSILALGALWVFVLLHVSSSTSSSPPHTVPLLRATNKDHDEDIILPAQPPPGQPQPGQPQPGQPQENDDENDLEPVVQHVESIPIVESLSILKKPSSRRSRNQQIFIPPRRTIEQQTRIDRAELKWNYLADEKTQEYSHHPDWYGKLKIGSRSYFNSLAVFSKADSSRHMHGLIGLRENHTAIWSPKPKPKSPSEYQGGISGAMRHGGFFLDMSDALPLDRTVPDSREQVCIDQKFDISSLPDSTIVITFFNEPLSTLLRTVYSVLNYTPAPLLREIILVDDHSDLDANLPGGPLYDHVKTLPKVKLMRLAERKGIVQARLTGARTARGDVLVVLDSHIEVGPGWLEPQLQRIQESPKSVVFPQILSLTHDTFIHKPESGIGCFLDFRWAIVEHARLTGRVKDTSVLPSPSMAGGLFAIRLDWFWELGGYDDEFVAWGAENVEMAFRVWMCGGRVECSPCSRTYHVFRKGGAGYANPIGALWRNRRRTAKIWMDEYDQLATPIIDRSATHSPDEDFGPIDKMLKLKERLKCHSFKWYLENVTPNHDVQNLSDVIGLGRIRSGNKCLDVNGSKTPGKPIISFTCHPSQNYTSNQGFLVSRDDENRIRLMSNDKRCVAWTEENTMQIQQCTDPRSTVWELLHPKRDPKGDHSHDPKRDPKGDPSGEHPHDPNGDNQHDPEVLSDLDSTPFKIRHTGKNKCLRIQKDIQLVDCEEDEEKIIWHIDKFDYD